MERKRERQKETSSSSSLPLLSLSLKASTKTTLQATVRMAAIPRDPKGLAPFYGHILLDHTVLSLIRSAALFWLLKNKATCRRAAGRRIDRRIVAMQIIHCGLLIRFVTQFGREFDFPPFPFLPSFLPSLPPVCPLRCLLSP